MSRIWTVKLFWLRLASIAAAAWIGGVIIASQVASNFRWITYYSDLGPASITAAVGAILVFGVLAAVPWLAEAADKGK